MKWFVVLIVACILFGRSALGLRAEEKRFFERFWDRILKLSTSISGYDNSGSHEFNYPGLFQMISWIGLFVFAIFIAIGIIIESFSPTFLCGIIIMASIMELILLLARYAVAKNEFEWELDRWINWHTIAWAIALVVVITILISNLLI